MSNENAPEIPDVWPPEEDGGVIVPMFPLRGIFLMPRQVMPLHVFEPRYRQMIDDVLDRSGRLVMATLLENDAEAGAGGSPRVLPIAGLGEIARHDKTPDGRYYVWLFGLGRHSLEEVDSDRLYRKVRARPVNEIEPTEKESDELAPLLRAALAARSAEPLELPDDIPVSVLADALSSKLQLPQPAMEPIYCESVVARRARMVLDAHEAFPPPSEG